MRIRDLLSELNQTNVKHIHQDISLHEAARTLSTFNIGALPVVDRDIKIVGIISERDIVRSIVSDEHDFFDKQVNDEMTSTVITCCPDDISDEIYQLIGKKNIRHIPVVENDELLAMLSIRDFEKVHEIVRRRSLTDELTGLYNLPHLMTLLDCEFNQYRRFQSQFSVATVTVDQFKNIEASNSYSVSDSLLKKLADTFSNNTRSFDIIGRTEDDQFVIAFRNTDRKTAIRACERIRLSVESEVADPVEGVDNITVSIGLAVANIDDSEGMEIMKRSADLSRAAAVSGGNCVEIDIEKLFKVAI